MDINVPKFQSKTETEINNYNTMNSVLSKLYSAESDLYKKRKEVFEDIGKIDENNLDLKNIYTNFSEELKKLENEKDEQITKIKTKLIPTTEAYISEAKKTKQEIGNYKNLKSKTKGQEEEMKKMEDKGQDIKNSQISLSHSQNKKTMKTMENTLENHIMKYEKDRISNNKLIMLHLINYEMAYHAKAIENLTNLFKKVKEINPKKSLKQSLLSVNVSQKTLNDIQESEDDSGKEEEDEEEEDEENIKDSKLKESKKTDVKKSISKSQKKDDNESEIDEEKD